MKFTPGMILITLAGTIAYLGLAVLGWGGIAAFFFHPVFIVLVVATFAMSAASLLTSGNLSRGEREDRSNRWVLVPFTIVGLLMGYLPALADRKDFWTLDGDMIRWIGIAIYIVGGALRIGPVFLLGNRFSGLVAIQPGHKLVKNGIYGVIRHPSYLGVLVYSLGWALVFRSGVGLVLAALMLPPLIARIRAEERLLHAQFGDEYELYRAHTSRLIPGIY